MCVMEGSEMKSSPICPAVVTYCAANEIPQQPCPCLLTAKPVPVGGVVWLAVTVVFVVLVAAIIKRGHND